MDSAWQCLREYRTVKLELVLKNGERGFQREDTERKDILESCGGRWGAGGGGAGFQCSDKRHGIRWSSNMLRALRPGLGWIGAESEGLSKTAILRSWGFFPLWVVGHCLPFFKEGWESLERDLFENPRNVEDRLERGKTRYRGWH